jgi:uncharacterized protein with PQ loop repeat
MHSEFFKLVMEGQFGIGLVINSLLYVPQILRLFKEKRSNELSYVMFLGFLCLTLSQVMYGFFMQDWIMAFGNMFTFLTCGAVVCLIIKYRKN